MSDRKPISNLADLKPDKRNARRHTPRNVGMIESSIQRDGFGRSVILANDALCSQRRPMEGDYQILDTKGILLDGLVVGQFDNQELYIGALNLQNPVGSLETFVTPPLDFYVQVKCWDVEVWQVRAITQFDSVLFIEGVDAAISKGRSNHNFPSRPHPAFKFRGPRTLAMARRFPKHRVGGTRHIAMVGRYLGTGFVSNDAPGFCFTQPPALNTIPYQYLPDSLVGQADSLANDAGAFSAQVSLNDLCLDGVRCGVGFIGVVTAI